MSEQFENLFKNLANGMSRRAALRRFFGGIAGAAAFALTGRRVAADKRGCGAWCAERYRDDGPGWAAACIDASAQCPDGECAQILTFSWGEGPQRGDGRPNAADFVCVPAD
jgi:hypothetical protein